MSLNWKEINIILEELDICGAQIQKIVQSSYSALSFNIYGRHGAQTLLCVTAPGLCRIHLTKRSLPKSEKPLRFAELLKSRVCNTHIEEAVQLGRDRIIRFTLCKGGVERLLLYFRLWSNAANIILTDSAGKIIDVMRRLPARGEVSGLSYKPEADIKERGVLKELRARELEGEGTFNEKIDEWYAGAGAALPVEALRAHAQKIVELRIARIADSIERLRKKEALYLESRRLKEYGEIILANIHNIKSGDQWLYAEDFFAPPESGPELVSIKLNDMKNAQDNAALYFERYRKAKNGLSKVREEIREGGQKISRQEGLLAGIAVETNLLKLQKLIKSGSNGAARAEKASPGLRFKRGEWLILVGRDARENDELLRRHVRGSDLWLHARDFPGSYVFVKARPGKTVPLDILLDAGNLALFYSKGRSHGKGDLFYTHVKYLRRAKNGPRGLVIPSQEKNLSISLDEKRLKEMEESKL